MATWKRVALIAAGFGAGFGICVAVTAGTYYWYSNRPKPWNKNALKATFATMEFDTRPQETSYKVDFLYDVENTTDRNYDFNSSNFTLLAVLADGNALSKEFRPLPSRGPKARWTRIHPRTWQSQNSRLSRLHISVGVDPAGEERRKESHQVVQLPASRANRIRGIRSGRSLRN